MARRAPLKRPTKKAYPRKWHHYFFPHLRNGYRPGIFRWQSVAMLVLVMVLIEGAYLFQINVVSRNTGFLASVLPAALTELANNDRAAQGVPALTEESLLDEAAQLKANDMAAKGYFSHVSPDGTTPWAWFDQVGYQYTYAGENLAVNFTDSQDVETAWMNSPLHRDNLLDTHYTQVGIGVAQGMYQGQETTFVVEFFARPASASAPVAATAVSQPSKPAAQVPADQIATTQKPAPATTPISSGQVLGSQTAPVARAPAPAPATGAAQKAVSAPPLPVVATSPYQVMTYILGGLAIFFALLLGITLFEHARKRYIFTEIITGGFVLVSVACLMLFINHSSVVPVSLPASSQSANVVRAL